MGLAHIDDVVAITQEFVHRTIVGTIVNNYQLPLGTAEGQGEDTVDTPAKHIDILIVINNDKTYYRK